MAKDLDGRFYIKNPGRFDLNVLIHLVFWRWIIGTLEAFWTWHVVVIEGKDSFTEDFWNELDFYSSSSRNPINFFEWTEYYS